MNPASRIVTLITGAGTGIGAASALKIAAHGQQSGQRPYIAIHYNTHEKEAHDIAKKCEGLGAQTLVYKADLAQDLECKAMVEVVNSQWGRIDNLVNCAGTTVFANYKDFQSVEIFNQILNINLYAAYRLTMHAAPYMQQQGGGRIVNISSMAGITGNGSSIPYAVSKGALNTLTLALAKAFEGDNIGVNSICPRVVESPAWWKRRFKNEEELNSFFEKQRKLGSLLSPDDVAETVVNLLTNSQHINGEIIDLTTNTHLGVNTPPKNNNKPQL